MKSQLIAIVAAMLLVGCGKSQDTDLNGKWLGKGYTCSVGDVKSDQEISISQDGDKVVATKITGDECVKAGEKTWEGKISGDWIEGVIYGWAANSPKPIPHKARIEIKSSNLLYFAPAGLEFVRIPDAEASKPEPPKGKAPDISFQYAARDGNIEAVKQAIADGADVNAKDDGWTPLHIAALNGRKEIAELLIVEGAEVNAKDDGDETPLDFAIKGKLFGAAAADDKYTKTADLLRKHGGKTGEELKAEEK
jgi:hypothetical protein